MSLRKLASDLGVTKVLEDVVAYLKEGDTTEAVSLVRQAMDSENYALRKKAQELVSADEVDVDRIEEAIEIAVQIRQSGYTAQDEAMFLYADYLESGSSDSFAVYCQRVHFEEMRRYTQAAKERFAQFAGVSVSNLILLAPAFDLVDGKPVAISI